MFLFYTLCVLNVAIASLSMYFAASYSQRMCPPEG